MYLTQFAERPEITDVDVSNTDLKSEYFSGPMSPVTECAEISRYCR